ncbi:MAG: hypothetical protein A3C13_02325 [Candidatus Lloydbacteria bacterium RIFCSPHIGHO2_02_FULL_50_11]|nr:MAG: hypothetical protein A3C13_02325 [Candidatus Lloydbacteria bacterium RIFCSPHIGHO2_02_FULL_50_11]
MPCGKQSIAVHVHGDFLFNISNVWAWPVKFGLWPTCFAGFHKAKLTDLLLSAILDAQKKLLKEKKSNFHCKHIDCI